MKLSILLLALIFIGVYFILLKGRKEADKREQEFEPLFNETESMVTAVGRPFEEEKIRKNLVTLYELNCNQEKVDSLGWMFLENYRTDDYKDGISIHKQIEMINEGRV